MLVSVNMPCWYLSVCMSFPIQCMQRDYSCFYVFGLVMCVCWVEADGPNVPSFDILCHSSLTCWHLPHRFVLCAALITVTVDLQIAKNPSTVSICSASSQWMGIRCMQGVHTDFQGTHTHTPFWSGYWRARDPKTGWCDNTLRGKWLKISDICANWPMIYIPMIIFSRPKERWISSR